MVTIDFHTHVFPPEVIARREEYCRRDRGCGLLYSSPRARMASGEQLLASMDEAGVDLSVVFGFAFADNALCGESNDYVLGIARAHPGRLLPFAVVNPSVGEVALAEARRCLEAGAVGIGELLPDGQGFALTDFALLDPLLDLARQAHVPVMCHVNERLGHVYAGKGSQGPEQAYQLALRYTQNVLVLAHWGGGLPFYELMPDVRADLANVYYDTAASLYLYEQTVFRHVMAWAADKVLWGSDYPLVRQRRDLRHLQGAGLDPVALAKVMGGNAEALLSRLKAPQGKGD